MDLYRRSSLLLLFFFRSIFSLSMLQCPITYEYHWYYEYFFFFFFHKFLRFQRYILDSYTSWRIIISYLLLYPRRKCASNIGRFAIQIQHTHSLRYPISFSWSTKGPTSARSFFSLTFSISPPAYVVRGWHRFQPRLLVANSSPIVDTRASSSLSFLSVLVNLEESE